MNNKLKNKKGISLIFLIIMVIILLVLVGISVNMVINGEMFNYAKNVAEIERKKKEQGMDNLSNNLTDEELISDFEVVTGIEEVEEIVLDSVSSELTNKLEGQIIEITWEADRVLHAYEYTGPISSIEFTSIEGFYFESNGEYVKISGMGEEITVSKDRKNNFDK